MVLPAEEWKVICPVEVPEGKSTHRILLPGHLAAQNPKVSLLAGDEVCGESWVEGLPLDQNFLLFLSLDREIAEGDWGQWLSGAESGSEGPFKKVLKYLPPQQLPPDPFWFLAADVLLLTPRALELFTPDQLQAVKEWAQLGGLVPVSGSWVRRAGDIFPYKPGKG